MTLDRHGRNLTGPIQSVSFELAVEACKKSKAVRAARQRPAEITTTPNPSASRSRPNVNGARA
jgi:hypothetical protein